MATLNKYEQKISELEDEVRKLKLELLSARTNYKELELKFLNCKQELRATQKEKKDKILPRVEALEKQVVFLIQLYKSKQST
jgi:chromosome segregation ATPase